MDKKSGFTTEYEKADAGTVAFETNVELAPEIDAYVEIVTGLLEEYAKDARIVAGLREIQAKLQALKFSSEPTDTLRAKLQELTQVPLGGDKKMHLGAFRRKSGSGSVGSESEYLTHVRKLVRNTATNLAQLVTFYPDDTILQKFVGELKAVNWKSGDYRTVRGQMDQMGKSPQLWHYNEKKKTFLVEWLKPFQDLLGKPIEELSEEELQAALKKVEELRDSKLEEMTNLVLEEDRGPFRASNRTMHAMMNGKNPDFWGGAEVRDQFIDLTQRIIRRYSFNLEDRFLIFRTQDGGFAYLVGFSDDAFERAFSTGEGKVSLAPHLKVFLRGGDGGYREIVESDYGGDDSAYYAALKTAVVPFLTAISVMVEFELTPQLKESFDMWT